MVLAPGGGILLDFALSSSGDKVAQVFNRMSALYYRCEGAGKEAEADEDGEMHGWWLLWETEKNAKYVSVVYCRYVYVVSKSKVIKSLLVLLLYSLRSRMLLCWSLLLLSLALTCVL